MPTWYIMCSNLSPFQAVWQQLLGFCGIEVYYPNLCLDALMKSVCLHAQISPFCKGANHWVMTHHNG